MNNQKKIVLIVVSLLSILLIACSLYYLLVYAPKKEAEREQAKYRALIEEFNSEQWNKYDTKLKGIEKAAKPLIECRHNIDKIKDSLESDYTSVLRKEFNNQEISAAERYKRDLYSDLKEMSSEMYMSTYWYDMESSGSRNYDWGIFIVDNPLNYNEERYLREKDDGEKDLVSKTKGLEEDLERINRLHCPKIALPIVYPPSNDFCIEMATAENRLRNGPVREDYDLEEEYQLDIDRFDRSMQNDIERCKAL